MMAEPNGSQASVSITELPMADAVPELEILDSDHAAIEDDPDGGTQTNNTLQRESYH